MASATITLKKLSIAEWKLAHKCLAIKTEIERRQRLASLRYHEAEKRNDKEALTIERATLAELQDLLGYLAS